MQTENRLRKELIPFQFDSIRFNQPFSYLWQKQRLPIDDCFRIVDAQTLLASSVVSTLTACDCLGMSITSVGPVRGLTSGVLLTPAGY